MRFILVLETQLHNEPEPKYFLANENSQDGVITVIRFKNVMLFVKAGDSHKLFVVAIYLQYQCIFFTASRCDPFLISYYISKILVVR